MPAKEQIRRILWVDDEIEQLKPLVFFLESKGYKVTCASNGNDALALIEKNNFDLVLLDEVMPGKDGLTTLEELKEKSPHLPVIMVTKSEEENLMNQAIGKKISDYLTKPVNPSQILSSAKKILESKRLRSEELTREYVEGFNKLQERLQEPLNWRDWIDIHRQLSLWDLEIDELKNEALREMLIGQKRECNSRFGDYVEKEYPDWLKSSNPPPLSVNVVQKYLFPILKESKLVYFFVIDCMRLDQWLELEAVLDEYFNMKRDYYYSILPSATPYARNAIFSGLFPEELVDKYPETWKIGKDEELSLNRYERQLLDAQLKKLGLAFKSEPKYVKVLDTAEGENLAKKISTYKNVPLLSVVYNFLDILAHGRSESEILLEIAPEEAAFRSLMRSWFLHSSWFEILKYLSTQDCVVVITTDHGSILGTRGTLAYGKKDTSTNLRYKFGDNLNCTPREAVLVKNPKEYRLPSYTMSTTYIIAKQDYYFIYPTNFHEYQRQFRNSFHHGGISLEEMILPVVVARPKK